MTAYQASRRMPYAAEQLFAIVADVARYAEFLPLCSRSAVTNRRELPDGRFAFHGELDISYPPLRIGETFVSEVTADPTRLTVRALSDSGPVKALDSRWLFRAVAVGCCEVEIRLEYTMSSRILQMVMASMFDVALRKVMAAFEARAREIYGPPSAGLPA